MKYETQLDNETNILNYFIFKKEKKKKKIIKGMGGVFSVDSYYIGKAYPTDWNGGPEEYEALKAIMYERIGEPNEIYQMLLGISKIIERNNRQKCSAEFFDFGYTDLINDVIKKYHLNDDIVGVACTILIDFIVYTEYGSTMVHSNGCLRVLSDLLTSHLKPDTMMCVIRVIKSLAYYYKYDVDVDISILYRRLLKIIHKYEDSLGICSLAVESMARTLYNDDNNNMSIQKFLKLNGVEEVYKLLTKHADSEKILTACSLAFESLSNRKEGIQDVLHIGGIEAIIDSVKIVRNIDALNSGLDVIASFSLNESSLCMRALDLGILDILRLVLEERGIDKSVFKTAALCLAILFSIDLTFKSGYREEATIIMDDIVAKFPESKGIRVFSDSFRRVENFAANECRKKCVCTRAGFGKCMKHPSDMYCKLCYVPQFLFKCSTCKFNSKKVYCLSCKERCHKGHKGETIFYVGRCDCNDPKCCCPPPPPPSSDDD